MIKRNVTTAPSLGQWSGASTLLGLSVAGSATSLYLNWTFGWEIGVVPAVGFAIADIGYFVLSVMKQPLRDYSGLRQIGRAVFMTMSLIAASSHLAQEFEQRQKNVEAVSAKVTTAKLNEKAARAELAGISESGDRLALQAEYDELKAKADREENRGGCLKKCEAAKDAARLLLPRIGAAKRRDELSASLTRASQTVAETPEKVFGGAATLAKLSGVSEAEIASYTYLASMGLIILALLIASAFSGAAAEKLAECFEQRKAAKAAIAVSRATATRGTAPALPAAPIQEIPAQPEAFSASRPKSVEEEMLLTVQMMVFHAPDQQLRTSIRELAKHLKVARATLQDWMMKWRDEGKISYHSRGNETIFQLPLAA